MEDINVKLDQNAKNDNTDNKQQVEFWQQVNRNSCEYESVMSLGAWVEADKV